MYKHFHNRQGILAPVPEMWKAPEDGHVLREVLQDFYTQVYSDGELSHFFNGVSMERAIDKQFSFLRSNFTGKKSYFGDPPINAHHWMIISNELFNHRESMMEKTLRKHQLPEHLIQRWMEVEEVFRTSIVKTRPRPRKLNGVALSLDGYESLVLDVSTLCDFCGTEIPIGDLSHYHRRTGKLNCCECYNRIEDSGHLTSISSCN